MNHWTKPFVRFPGNGPVVCVTACGQLSTTHTDDLATVDCGACQKAIGARELQGPEVTHAAQIPSFK